MADIDAQDIDEIVRSECAACRDEVDLSDVMLASCGCIYCKDCVNRLFDLAARSESDFPPRCCGLFITLEIAEQHLSVDVKNKFQEAYEEFTTTDRIYCSDPRCARFISPKAIDDGRAKCPTCRRLTCILCKEEAHVFDCPEDPAVRSLMTAAAQLGFQQCRECKRMVELMDGCYHITCICGAEFCYACGTKWKTGGCGCLTLNEQDLEDQVEQTEDAEREEMLQFAVENVERVHPDGRIDWRV